MLASRDGKIVFENTLDARLDVVFRKKLPEVFPVLNCGCVYLRYINAYIDMLTLMHFLLLVVNYLYCGSLPVMIIFFSDQVITHGH